MAEKFVSRDIATSHLDSIHKKINQWGQLVPNDGSVCNWTRIGAPIAVHSLRAFSQHIVGCLPVGNWFLIQINDATVLDSSEKLRLSRIVGDYNSEYITHCSQSILIEARKDSEVDESRLILVDLVFFFVEVSGHVHIVSSRCDNQECIGIQDGFVYFYSDNTWANESAMLIEKKISTQSGQPEWVLQFLARA